jgi:uncharacterized protein
MKNIVWLSLMMVGLAGCTTQNSETTSPKVGMANPASQYCTQQGGKLELRNESQGQVGYCHLASGQVVEEWALFRASQSNCSAEDAKRLIGQSKLSEAQIKALSKAQIVRMVQPGQPVTMDYRVERVTVTIDPKTQKITAATCG